LNANPTQGELLHYEFRQKKEELKDTTKTSILAKYGGAEYLDTAPKELRQGQTEDYVEYSRTGQIIKGRERAKAKSKYPEDGNSFFGHISFYNSECCSTVYINNHTAVWGSWYNSSDGTWGYACCHSNIHISYCSGQAGIDATEASSAQHLLASAPQPAAHEPPKDESQPQRSDKVDQNYSKRRIGEGEVKLDDERLARAVREEKKRKERGGKDMDDRSGKKQKGGLEVGSHDVTEEELGLYLNSLEVVYKLRLFLQRRTG
jgi:pre-mRNA-processing factor SLU7